MARTSSAPRPSRPSSRGTSGRARAGTTPAGSRRHSGSGSGASRKPRAASPSSAPWFPIALFGLFAIGCVASSGKKPRRRYVSFQVDADSPLYEVATDAASQWTAALGLPVLVSPDGEIPIFITASPSCPPPSIEPKPGDQLGGCAMDVGTPHQRIEVSATVEKEKWPTLLLHEMGHHIRRVRGHLDDPEALMGARVPNGRGITAADVQFVCKPSLDCSPPLSFR